MRCRDREEVDHSFLMSLDKEKKPLVKMGIDKGCPLIGYWDAANEHRRVSTATGVTRGNAKRRGAFDARGITLRAQHSIACNFPNQTKRFFLDETTSHLVDTVHRLVWLHTRSKERANYIVKQLLKVNIKLYVVASSGLLRQQQEEDLGECREVIRQAAVCFIRHVQGDTRPRSEVLDLERIQAAIKTAGAFARFVSEEYLSKKTVDRLADVVKFFVDEKFLSALLSNQPHYTELAVEIAHDLQDSIDRGIL
ncbi:Tumor necrosi factor alpha-induced protein 8-like protein 2 [Taenia crassiceps]|uniref:Tumor necrosi factor alpha-induced protein 8-like protein 2 n=1 Tax=Taenia crassiceps TaxID=6207 RepID=A0ABR4Q9J9_9CEST